MNPGSDLQQQAPCPVCNGSGGTVELYTYRSTSRREPTGEPLKHRETCRVCQGRRLLTFAEWTNWQQEEASLVRCPLCQGTGGKRWWSLVQDETHTEKVFDFQRCRICDGRRSVSAEAVAAFAQEQQRLRVYGVGCAGLAIIGVVSGITLALSAFLNAVPWYRCFAPPELVLPALVGGWVWVKVSRL